MANFGILERTSECAGRSVGNTCRCSLSRQQQSERLCDWEPVTSGKPAPAYIIIGESSTASENVTKVTRAHVVHTGGTRRKPESKHGLWRGSHDRAVVTAATILPAHHHSAHWHCSRSSVPSSDHDHRSLSARPTESGFPHSEQAQAVTVSTYLITY